MRLSPRDRRTVRAVVLERWLPTYRADGWEYGQRRGDGYVLVSKRFGSNGEVAAMLEVLDARHVTAWVE